MAGPVKNTASTDFQPMNWGNIIKGALMATLVGFGLFVLLIGFRTDQQSNDIVLAGRPVALAITLGVIFLLSLFVLTMKARKAAEAEPLAITTAIKTAIAPLSKLQPLLRPFLIAFVLTFPAIAITLSGWQGALTWIDNFGVQILIYIMLGWGLNVVVGLAGLLDLGYVAFYAVGAYSYAILSTKFGISFWLILPISGVLAAFWGIILGFPVLRLRGDYLAVVTLAFGEIIRTVLINWIDFSNGYAGISGIPRPTFFGIPFNASDSGFAATFGLEFTPLYRTIFLYYLILMLALITAWVTTRLRQLPIGRAWEALREDEIACRSLGINTVTTKLTAFSIGAAFGGLAGAFFATRQGFVSPESFKFEESAQILAIVVLGGSGSLLGVVIAAVGIVGGFELLRNLDWLRAIFGNDFDPTQYRTLIFGLAMVLIMLWKPRGLISSREPTVFLKERKSVSADLIKEGHG